MLRLISARALMPVILKYKKNEAENEEVLEAIGYMNYGGDEVFFPNNPELSTEEVRRYILASQDSKIVSTPQPIPKDILEMISNIRAGNYGATNG